MVTGNFENQRMVIYTYFFFQKYGQSKASKTNVWKLNQPKPITLAKYKNPPAELFVKASTISNPIEPSATSINTILIAIQSKLLEASTIFLVSGIQNVDAPSIIINTR